MGINAVSDFQREREEDIYILIYIVNCQHIVMLKCLRVVMMSYFVKRVLLYDDDDEVCVREVSNEL